MVQLSTGWVFLLGKCSLQEQPVKGQFWEHSSDSKVSLPGARSLLREGRHCSKCSALSSFLIGKALHDSSNTAIPLPLGGEYLLSCFNATCSQLLTLKANQNPAWQRDRNATWLHGMNHLERKSATEEPTPWTPPPRRYWHQHVILCTAVASCNSPQLLSNLCDNGLMLLNPLQLFFTAHHVTPGQRQRFPIPAENGLALPHICWG